MRGRLFCWGKPTRAALARLGRDRSGATIIEFAAVVTPLIALFTAITQISLTFFAQELLESATERAVRQLLTGQAQQNNMTAAQFKALMCDASKGGLPSFMPCANLYVQVSSANSWSNVNTSPPTITYDAQGNMVQGGFNPGNDRAINVVQALYIWNVQSGPLGFDISNMSGQRRTLYSTSVVQTEPYK